MNEASNPIRYVQYKSGSWQEVSGSVIAERAVSLTVNGEVWLTLMCTPVDLEALAIGFLYNENTIQSISEVASVRVCPTGDNIDVWLNFSVERPKDWRRTSGCTGGATSSDPASTSPVVQDGIVLAARDICSLIERLLDSQELYRDVGGVHTSALSDGKEILVSADDIGRHNTLDKIAGRCLLDQIESSHRVLLTTGRISSEMMQKAARIGASIVISRTSPSSLSIELAQRYGITLIGYARRDRYNIYTYPERILQNSDSVENVVF
ncbi:MAG: formate dehydrogenase accessory sulfurtransferase FdhD [Chloroflexota bacterium]|nr:MAG: formate dehydrogenase accessory sulfurtransferase FdhD [Chloroflexota bacterium]